MNPEQVWCNGVAKQKAGNNKQVSVIARGPARRAALRATCLQFKLINIYCVPENVQLLISWVNLSKINRF